MHLTRRHFLQSTGATALYLGVAPALALAGPIRPVKRKKTIVVIFLRGGIDGLNLLVPHADPEYRRLRPSIGIPGPKAKEGACLDLDGFYGLHPAMRNLRPHFTQGTACAVQAVGYATNTRSHFEEQDTWETGVIGNTVHSDGWLNRHLATSASEQDAPIRALAIGNTLPRLMRGKASTFAIRGLDDLTLPGKGDTRDKMAKALEKAYGSAGGDMGSGTAGDRRAAGDLLEQTGAATLEGLNTLKKMTSQPYTPAAKYPENGFAKRLMEVARLIKADIGLEVAEVDLGGWDTHNNQGRGATGAYAQRLGALSNSIAAFLTDLGPKLDDTLVLTLSEFGRTAAENGTAGTDHGWGNALLAFGGPVKQANAVRGGGATPVIGAFPGLKKSELNRGRDLQHLIDFRDVISEAVGVHLGNTNLGKVIPGYEAKPVG
ncbi:MAG: DUF1501 domain-containing protein, partial [Planctomycetota bacterium]